MLRYLIGRCIPVLVLSCSAGLAQGATTRGDTGIEGVRSISPTHGGPVRADSQSSAPLAETEFVIREDDKTVATFKTDAEGKFTVALPPGHYAIRARTGMVELAATVPSKPTSSRAE